MAIHQKLLDKFKNIARDRPFLGALAFTILFYILEENLLTTPQGTYLKFLMLKTPMERAIGLSSTLLAFLLFFFFIWVSLIVAYKFKIFYFLILAIAVIVQYGYWNAFHRFMSIIDFHTAIKSPFDLWGTSGGLFFDWWSLLPVVLYGVLLFGIREPRKNNSTIFLALIFVIIGVGVVNHYVKYERNLGVSLLSLFHTITSAALSEAQSSTRETITFKSDTKPQNNIVLVIDESIRADHLSINGYERPTTPYLEELADLGYLYTWGTATAGATCSPISNALLITGASIDTNSQVLVTQYPTLFHYAKAMGYRTYYFDAQASFLWNGLQLNDLAYVDHWIKSQEIGGGLDRDFRAAERIREIVAESVGNFIILNKRGVHFLYEGSYPPDHAIWLPTPPNRNYRGYPELAVNAYDNGVLFNVNTFFQNLIPNIDTTLDHTTYIYTSDHGQTLFENGVSWLHCNFTKNEASVPLVVIGSFDQPVDTNYRGSHSNIFATILDLFDVPCSKRAHNYSPSLFVGKREHSPKRHYFDGTLSINDFDE